MYSSDTCIIPSDTVLQPAKDDLLSALKDLVENETDRNPSLLSKDPRMATSIIEGAGERINIYANIMHTVNTLLDKLIEDQGLPKMREYRIQEIGVEAAREEEQRGSKSEEAWAQEAETRRQEREAVREKELEHQRQLEREERAKKEERKRREREQEEAREKERQAEKERRRKEREERDRAEDERRRKERERIDREREEERARYEKEKEEHEATREARLKKIREQDAERERRLKQEEEALSRDRGSRYRAGLLSVTDHETDVTPGTGVGEGAGAAKPEDIKMDDDAVLQLLLQESEQIKKSRQRPVLARSESLEPPMRKAQPPKSLVPRDPVAARLAKLNSKSQSPAPSPSKEPETPRENQDTVMEDAPPREKTPDTAGRSRWDAVPPQPSKGDKSRGRSRSASIAQSAPGHVHHRAGTATTADHLVTKMIVGLAGRTTDIRTDRATTETTSDLIVQAAVDLATLMPAAANRVTTQEVRLQKIVSRTVAVTAVAHVLREVAADVEVVATARAREAGMVSTDTYLEAVLLEKPQPLPLLTRPQKTLSMTIPEIVSMTILEIVSAMILEIGSAMTADLADETIVATGIEAIGLATMIAGTVDEPGVPALTSLIAIFPAEVVAEMIKLPTRRPETGAEAATEIEIVVETIVTGGDVQRAGVAVATGVDDSHDVQTLYH
ncbi:hypothetical protein DE146DRAFT_622214 [Phaeosphaeria sp. MPI-PUGE-AT-0046c]|nr:hypothetical protein DE146DRAFT_622214 [Phaeosphaeria sp. MPI-PUGE-AT-0046c]